MNDHRDDEKYMSIFDHLEEMRSRIIRSLLAVVLGAIVSGIFIKRIFLSLTRPVPHLYWHTPLEPYFTFLKIAIVVGIFIAFPYVLFQMWRFVSPGLYKRERKYLLPFIVSSWVLFCLGAVFVFTVMMPFITSYLYGTGLITDERAPRPLEERWETVAETLLLQRGAEETDSANLEELYKQIADDLITVRSEEKTGTQVGNVWSVGRYIQLVLVLFLAFGLAFDLPVVVVMLTTAGIVQPATLAKARPVVVVVVFLFSALLTPPDPVSQIMMGVPMYLLFEISLVASRVLLKLRKKSS